MRSSPNDLSDRAAMGLPPRFVARSGADLRAAHREVAGKPAHELVTIAESTGEPFASRLAAGSLLALAGDPRIDVEQPAMVRIPGGRARLGLAPGRVDEIVARWAHAGVQRDWIAKECPDYELDILPFQLGRYPVTNAEYRTFLEDTNAPWLPESWRFGVYPDHQSNHPVWTVPPEGADAYVAWLARRTGRRFRLPTEAEWEYAASGGTGQQFPWGEKFRPEVVNTVEAGPLTTTPIGIYPAGRSPFGLDDMGGNVEEYTSDEYQAYPGGDAVADDLVVAHGRYRIARGGSFSRFGDLARCQRRHGWYRKPIYVMGFRIAEDV